VPLNICFKRCSPKATDVSGSPSLILAEFVWNVEFEALSYGVFDAPRRMKNPDFRNLGKDSTCYDDLPVQIETKPPIDLEGKVAGLQGRSTEELKTVEERYSDFIKGTLPLISYLTVLFRVTSRKQFFQILTLLLTC